MADLVRTLVPLMVVMGLAAALAVLLSGGGAGGALAVLLDFLLAAGLLRLSQAQTWAAIITAALTVLVRKLAVAGFSAHTARRRPPGRRPTAPTPSGRDQGRTR
ncbi:MULTISPECIES: hypothetical protein [unclassified Streptosporangium]|uniref:hypothetical protein n=1 Tax=unclassified Streptosporangium TaxID=2632669 RepID=UPI002E2D779C|nr:MULTISPECIES: hypothetical protein [unclassified Streptosporangium]